MEFYLFRTALSAFIPHTFILKTMKGTKPWGVILLSWRGIALLSLVLYLMLPVWLIPKVFIG